MDEAYPHSDSEEDGVERLFLFLLLATSFAISS